MAIGSVVILEEAISKEKVYVSSVMEMLNEVDAYGVIKHCCDLGIIKLYNVENEKQSKVTKDIIANRDLYYLSLESHYKDMEANQCDIYSYELDKTEVEEVEDYTYEIGLKIGSPVEVVGEVRGAPSAVERIRVFTNYFSQRLLLKEFEEVSRLYCSVARANNTAEDLKRKVQALEDEYGSVLFSDHVEVQSVYNGKDSDKKVFEEMKLPKGVERSQRRGESVFRLVSSCSPNGVAFTEYSVYLAIIEEDGLLKVSGSRWYMES